MPTESRLVPFEKRLITVSSALAWEHDAAMPNSAMAATVFVKGEAVARAEQPTSGLGRYGLTSRRATSPVEPWRTKPGIEFLPLSKLH
jgi:hypothetical protein